MNSTLHLTILAGAILFAIPAWAQPAPHVIIPDAGHVLVPPTAPQDTASSMPTPQLDLTLPAGRVGTVRFTNVRVTGARAVKADEIIALFAPLKGQAITPATLKVAVDKVNALYLAAGYPLGRAYIPAQVMHGGTLVVRVVEGYVANLEIEADTSGTKALVEKIAAHLTEEKPLTSRRLQRYMLIIQDLPGITVGSKFQSMDPRTGATTLILSAKIKPATATFLMDNRANLARLPFQPYLTATFNNLLGNADQTSVTALLSPRQQDYAFYAIGYSQLVGTEGLSMGLDASWAQTLDYRSFAPYDVRSQASHLGYVSRYPLVRAMDEQLNIDGKLYYVHAGYSFAHIPIAHDDFVTARIGGDYARSISSQLVVSGNLYLTQGVSDMGAQPHTRSAVQPNFTKLQGEARLVYKPTEKLTVNLGAGGQFGSGSLYSSEEIAFGGLQYGRGFGAAEITGDSGFGVAVQPEYTIPFDWTQTGLGRGWSVTPYLLFDYAKTLNTAGDGEPDGELVSAGVGCRLAVSDLITLTLEADKPINRIPLFRENRDPRFYGGIQFGLDRASSLIEESL
jgi:hemolysin activation/secretion protein